MSRRHFYHIHMKNLVDDFPNLPPPAVLEKKGSTMMALHFMYGFLLLPENSQGLPTQGGVRTMLVCRCGVGWKTRSGKGIEYGK